MFDTIAGLPVHALVVHAVVVLGPLAALMLLAYALRPTWRTGLRWPTLLLSAVAAASAFVATQSGEALEERVGDPAFDHAEKGDLAAISMYVLLGAAVVVIFLLARAGRDASTSAVGTVVALAAVAFAVFAVFNAGHSGASSVWKDIVANTTPSGGDD
ncbi:DUF2231 domain-containing protein [Nocardioides okcheonensis]|uniref:DUF2231 domain-containing protein n=1 Tax=Nocardioides okcheonensis TaxID=2894081 RepID=UPI001E3A12A1|nr:DUF2231 domain-containing protein [Nocardioides okcheonensis]UFN43160.1 hypothetical protein LN652_14000 [Nocardioides okcheonensis]